MDLHSYIELREAYGSMKGSAKETLTESLADAPAANTPAAAAPNAKEAFPKDRVERAKKQASPKNAVKEEEEKELDTFDIILEYLMGRGFPEEDAMKLMATMEDEKREKITAEAVSWDKYGRPKSKEGKAKAARAQAEMRVKDRQAGRDRYGYKTGYARKTWDER